MYRALAQLRFCLRYPLERIMAQPPTSKQPDYDIAVVFQEIHGDSDRAAAITAAAFFDEEILVSAIAAHLIKLGVRKKDKLFDSTKGPLSSFYARALMGHALGLYGPITLADLDKVRKIRNEFAHRPGISSFEHPDVAAKCIALHTAKNVAPTMNPRANPPNTPRAFYLDTLLEIGARLMRSGPRMPRYLTPEDNGLL